MGQLANDASTWDCRGVVETYLQAKDYWRPGLMERVCVPEAVLEFSLANADMAFPARVPGRDAITRTLVAEFGLRFKRCRTYCVCDQPPRPATGWELPWLVVMQEADGGDLRLGRGFYRWQFTGCADAVTRAHALHIHIERMDRLDDPDAGILAAIQAGLTYPWLSPALLERHLLAVAAAFPGQASLAEFAHPLRLPLETPT